MISTTPVVVLAVFWLCFGTALDSVTVEDQLANGHDQRVRAIAPTAVAPLWHLPLWLHATRHCNGSAPPSWGLIDHDVGSLSPGQPVAPHPTPTDPTRLTPMLHLEFGAEARVP